MEIYFNSLQEIAQKFEEWSERATERVARLRIDQKDMHTHYLAQAEAWGEAAKLLHISIIMEIEDVKSIHDPEIQFDANGNEILGDCK